MTILQLIFAILQRFVPIPPKDLASMENEANAWHTKVLDKNNPTNNPVQKFYQEYGTEWYVRLFLACIYIPLCYWTGGVMNELNTPKGFESNDTRKGLWG